MFSIRVLLVTIAVTVAIITTFFKQDFRDIANDKTDAVVLILRDATDVDGMFSSGLGAGFFIGPNIIVTNTHVVDGAETLSIKGAKSKAMFSATVINKNYTTDIALLRIDDWDEYMKANGMEILKFAASRELVVGDTVWSVGHPWGLYWSVSEGIVSFPYRRIDSTMMYYIQTDAFIHPGNSGGPLLNASGDVVGIVSKIYSPEDNDGFGLAIPSDIANNIVSYMKISKPVELSTIGVDLTQSADNQNVVVTEVLDWPSTRGVDIKPGDKLVEVTTDKTGLQGAEIRSIDDLINELVIIVPGDQIILTLMRDDQLMFVTITTEGLPIL